MYFIQWLYTLLGSLICHQLPQRSLSIQGQQLPMCARDTGIYLGIFVTLFFLLLKKRFASNRLPNLFVSVCLCFLMLPMLADGIGSFLGIYDSNNSVRLLTGFLFGSTIPYFLIPAAHFSVEEQNDKAVLKSFWELIIVLAIDVSFAVVLVRSQVLPWLILSTMMMFSFIFMIARILYTLIIRIEVIKRQNPVLWTTGSTLVVLLLMYVTSHFLLRPMNNYF